jgi:iron complex transport system substrate-binding protein
MQRFRSTLLVVALAIGLVNTAATAAGAADRPERIVSLSPTATEMLFAIDAGDQVVAVDDQSDFPTDVPSTDLSGFEPNVEAIAGYNPDLVVMSDDSVKDQLGQLGIKVLVLPGAKQLTDTYAQIKRLGGITGHGSAAKQLVREMRGDIADLRDTVPGGADRPTAYYELDDTLFSADSSTFIGRLLRLGGFDNIADQAQGKDSGGYPQLSAEFIVDEDPDVIFLADTECCGQSTETLAKRAGFTGLTAIRDDHVVELSDDVASRWGPRVVDLLRQIVKERKTL